MRRILAATLIGVLTGSLLTTVEPIISTPPTAQAAPVTVGGCEVDVVDQSIGQLDKNHIGLAGGDSDPSGDGNPEYIRVSKDGNDCVLEFLKDSTEMTWTLPDTTAMELLIAGGGGGGSLGGGGAGGFVQQSEFLNPREKLGLTAKIYVGAGGAGRSTPLNNVSTAPPGDDSWLFGSQSTFFGSPSSRASTSIGIADLNSAEFVMKGGGGGGDERYSGGSDGDGGSGGGAAEGYYDTGYDGGYYNGLLVGQRVNSNFGTNGGDAGFGTGLVETTTEEHGVGGGGGGAGGSGFTGLLADTLNDTQGGNGGVGKSSTITGSTRYFSGGGGGAAVNPTSGDRFGGSGGTGGGGAGGTGNGSTSGSHIAGGSAGASNTGGGGGGGNDGGSGIVIVRYSPPPVDPAPVLGSVTRLDDGFSVEITNYAEVLAASDSVDVTLSSGTKGFSGSTVTVTGLSSGASSTVTVTASADGFSDATATVTGKAKSAQSALSISSASTIGYLGSLSLTTSGGSGDGAVTFSASGTGCSVSGSTLSVDGTAEVGDICTVSATKAADDDFKAVSASDQMVTVVKADQAALTITNSGEVGLGGSVELAVSGGSGNGALSWSESCGVNFDIDGTTLSTSATVGSTCTVTATKASSTNYNAVSDTQVFIVVKASPVFDSYDSVSAQVGSADVTLDDPTVQVNGSAFTAGSIGWTSADDTVADVTGSTLSFESVGETTLTATFTPTDSSSYETVTLAVTVTVTAVPPAPRGGNDDDEATPVPTAGPTVGPAVPGRPGVPGGVPGRPGGNPGGVGSPGVTPGGGTPPPPPGGTSGNPIPPERPGASVGGVPVPTATTASPGGRGVSVSAGGVDVGVDVPDSGDGRGGVIDRDGIPEPVVTPGQGKTVSGAGAAPGSVVDVWLPGRGGNAPTNIAQIPVGADGTFSADVDVFAGSGEPLPIGRNVVQIVTTNAEGEDIVVDMPFTLTQGEPTPEVLRNTGSTPDAPTSGIINTNKGEPTETRVVSDPSRGLVSVESDTWAFTVGINTTSGVVEGANTDTVIRTTSNTEVTVSGSGFMADTRVDVWAFSTPTLLGNATVDSDGTVSVTVTVTPQSLEVGAHTLQLQAVGQDGFIRTSNLPIEIQDTPASLTTGDSAGTLLWWTVSIAAAIIVLALLVAYLLRRRQRT